MAALSFPSSFPSFWRAIRGHETARACVGSSKRLSVLVLLATAAEPHCDPAETAVVANLLAARPDNAAAISRRAGPGRAPRCAAARCRQFVSSAAEGRAPPPAGPALR
jgi:hypothetical protein